MQYINDNQLLYVKMQKSDWAALFKEDPLTDEERRAYERMQSAIAASQHSNQRPFDTSHAVIRQEGNALDLITVKGRATRSAKNLHYLREQNADCPKSLLGELTGIVKRKKCALVFDYFSHEEDVDRRIAESGHLSSNLALRDSGESTSGGSTGTCVVDDDKEFGNVDFVFTRPLFYDSDTPIRYIREKFYLPGDHLIAGQIAWLSFTDWADFKGGGKPQDEYVGNSWRRDDVADVKKSFICDFYVGKDIPEAIALKTFETIKTAILLAADDTVSGFNIENAMQFLDNIAHAGYRRGRLREDNKLEKPLAALELNDRQKEFLLTRSDAKDAFIKKAVESTLIIMRDHAEIKVPRFVALDGAALPKITDDENGKEIILATQFKAEAEQADRIVFDDSKRPVKCRTETVPADTRKYVAAISYACPGN